MSCSGLGSGRRLHSRQPARACNEPRPPRPSPPYTMHTTHAHDMHLLTRPSQPSLLSSPSPPTGPVLTNYPSELAALSPQRLTPASKRIYLTPFSKNTSRSSRARNPPARPKPVPNSATATSPPPLSSTRTSTHPFRSRRTPHPRPWPNGNKM
jgi:hypothetical protein